MKILNKLSFHKKIFLACLLTALVPLLCSSVVMIRLFTAALDRQNLDEGRTQITKAEARLEAVFEKCEEACKTIATDKKTARIMIEKSEADHQREMYLSLYQATQETSGYARFSIYDSGGRLCYTTDTEGKEKDLPVFWGLLRKASRTDDIVYYRTDPDLSITDGDILLQGARPLYTEGGAKTGYIVFDFTRENLDDLLGAEVSSGDVLLLLDTHKRTVYCSGQDKSQVQTGDMIEKILENRKMSDAGHDREQYLVSHGGKTGFYFLLCRQAPMSQPAVQTMWTVGLCLSALGLFLCLAVSGVLTGSIARPVQTLDEAMEKVKKGDLSIRIHTQSNDEMGRLTRSFNQMTEDLGRYMEDKVQRQKDLNETTLKLYQTQLNPHFLYNTLDTIKWEARIRQVPRIAVLAENLAIILRKSISSKPFIPLREELETIDSYVEVQKIRFTGRFLCEKEIPDQLEECLVPKMILQPLVENAIIHGLEGCENGYICIYAGREGDVLNISITDDGRGMSPELLAWINSPEPEKRDGHLGLYNIMRILKLYYGNEYGLKAEVTEDGTTVTLRLPDVRSGSFGAERP